MYPSDVFLMWFVKSNFLVIFCENLEISPDLMLNFSPGVNVCRKMYYFPNWSIHDDSKCILAHNFAKKTYS